MLTFRLRSFLVIIGLSIFALIYISVGIRWHVYRARASLYARKEVQHTFEAAHFSRAARIPFDSDESRSRSAGYRKLAEMHEKAALECTRLREFYEHAW